MLRAYNRIVASIYDLHRETRVADLKTVADLTYSVALNRQPSAEDGQLVQKKSKDLLLVSLFHSSVDLALSLSPCF